jgi:hypothetical protein
MRLTRSEIRANALRFAAGWKDASDERADAQDFWTELFAVFGVHRRSVASFERKVRNLAGHLNRIDVFYAGIMIGEHKSRGEDLAAAASQAFGYVQDLTREVQARDGKRGSTEIPRFVVVSDFARIVVYDLEAPDPLRPAADFATADLADHIDSIGFMGGFTTRRAEAEDDINIEAVELLGNLHDALERAGYRGHHLERFLVRVLFCLFADDTEIFEPDIFKEMVAESRADGSDLGPMLERWFRVLDTPRDQRAKNLPEALRDLPYVNGQLFAERLEFADFDTPMRDALLAACGFNWSRISPAVFGSLFQSIMAGAEGARQRRQIGAHYTSERDILKLIRSLFLDDLHAMLAKANTGPALQRFQDHLASLKFLDPACGCGNFLVVAYREIRLLELEALKRLHARKPGQVQRVLNVQSLLRVQVDQMHGIEIEEWPARIAEVAMWLIDHQMNRLVAAEFGEPVLRLPLERGAKIHLGNALRTDWNTVLPAEQCSFVMGNPPFIGHHLQTKAQKADQNSVWSEVQASGVLDFVTCWYRKAATYIQSRQARCAFVSTNSITQGEQPGIFWPTLIRDGIEIHFAHRTFKWESEARGKAHVHVVIIGFGGAIEGQRSLWLYESDDGDKGTETRVTCISPYLFEGPMAVLTNRTDPICDVPKMRYGNKPTDGGNFILSPQERDELISSEPAAEKYIKRYIGATEFLDDTYRYCLWLPDIPPSELRAMPRVFRRIQAVREFRAASKAEATRKYADYPTRFRQIAQTDSHFIVVPRHTSENREYIPFAYFGPEVIVSDACFFIPDTVAYHLGMISSRMHMAWVREFCGRLESRYRYNKDIVYNNFPWPTPTDAQRAAVEATAQAILDARAQYPGQTLADLYDPVAMPKPLRDAHAANDRAVDRCYRPQPFTTERARVEFLFDLYQKLTAPLTAPRTTRTRARR